MRFVWRLLQRSWIELLALVHKTLQRFFTEDQHFIFGQLEFAEQIKFRQFLYGGLSVRRSFAGSDYLPQNSAGRNFL